MEVDEATAGVRDCLAAFHRTLCRWYARAAAETLAGFDSMTRQLVDTDGMTVLRAWLPPLAEHIERLDIASHKPEEKNVKEWEQLCLKLWNREMSLHAPQGNGKS